MAKRTYRQFREVEEEYFRTHPEEIDAYLDEIFDEYAEDHNSAALLASLRVIAKVKGISHIAEKTGMTRQGVQHALSNKGNPRFDNVNSIMNALGYRLVPEKLDSTIISTCESDMNTSTSIRIDQTLYEQARSEALVEHRTIAGQIEYWARVGRAALDNPDLPVSFIAESLASMAEPRSEATDFVPRSAADELRG